MSIRLVSERKRGGVDVLPGPVDRAERLEREEARPGGHPHLVLPEVLTVDAVEGQNGRSSGVVDLLASLLRGDVDRGDGDKGVLDLVPLVARVLDGLLLQVLAKLHTQVVRSSVSRKEGLEPYARQRKLAGGGENYIHRGWWRGARE